MRIISTERDINILRRQTTFNYDLVIAEYLNCNRMLIGIEERLSGSKLVLFEKGDNPRNLEWLSIHSNLEGIFSLRKFEVKKIECLNMKVLFIQSTIDNKVYIFIVDFKIVDENIYSYFSQFC